MSLSDLIAHDEHRRSTMTREKYLARIWKIGKLEKLDAAQIVATRHADTEATLLIGRRREIINPRQYSRQRDAVRVNMSGRLEIDWDGYAASLARKEAEEVQEKKEEALPEPVIRQIRFRKKG